MSSKASTTIGFERASTRRSRTTTSALFVAESAGISTPRPPNMERIVELNRGPFVGATTGAALELAEPPEGAQILDVRPVDEPSPPATSGALSVPVSGTRFSTKAAFVLDRGPVVVVASTTTRPSRATKRPPLGRLLRHRRLRPRRRTGDARARPDRAARRAARSRAPSSSTCARRTSVTRATSPGAGTSRTACSRSARPTSPRDRPDRHDLRDRPARRDRREHPRRARLRRAPGRERRHRLRGPRPASRPSSSAAAAARALRAPGGPTPLQRCEPASRRVRERSPAMLLITRRDDELDLGLERARRAALPMVVDGDDIAAALRDRGRGRSQLSWPVGDEQADRRKRPPCVEAVPEDRDERRRIDVPAREDDGHGAGALPAPARSAARPTAPAPSTRSFVRSTQNTSASEISSSDTATVVEDTREDRRGARPDASQRFRPRSS